MSSVKESIATRAAEQGFVGLWEIVGEVEATQPQQGFVPYIWRWSSLKPLLDEVGANITLEDADRRVVIMSNPGARRKHHSTNTLYLSCSIYNPGESAPVHRHTSNASRFVLEGSGGFTTIEGEKCPMSRGDLILTPAGTWHDHGNEGTEPVIWVEVLDLPLVENLSVSNFEFDYHERDAAGKPVRKEVQTVTHPQGHSYNLYGSGGLLPTFVDHQRGQSVGTPMFVYRWSDAKAALQRLRGMQGSPYDGIMLEYVNPATGGPVTTTTSFCVQLLRPGERTQAHRQTCSTAYCCLEGRGRTVVGDTVMEWGPNDMFVVPSWMPHRHENLSATEDACLYSVSDAPAIRRLDLYREEPA